MKENSKEIERRRSILAYLHHCLIGEVPKKLRLVSVDWTQDTACLHFYFDGEIEERDHETVDLVHTYFVANFTEDNMRSCGLDIVRIDEPLPIPYEGECVFARKEKYDN